MLSQMEGFLAHRDDLRKLADLMGDHRDRINMVDLFEMVSESFPSAQGKRTHDINRLNTEKILFLFT
jgi:hypothetical protein